MAKLYNLKIFQIPIQFRARTLIWRIKYIILSQSYVSLLVTLKQRWAKGPIVRSSDTDCGATK